MQARYSEVFHRPQRATGDLAKWPWKLLSMAILNYPE
jgi:hypothetical protein